LLVRHAPEILFGQIYFLLVYARPWSSLKGYASFIAALPAVCRKRREIARTMTIDRAALSALLGNRPPHPSLWSHVRARVTRAFGVRAEA
jgi:hypothetical protein